MFSPNTNSKSPVSPSSRASVTGLSCKCSFNSFSASIGAGKPYRCSWSKLLMLTLPFLVTRQYSARSLEPLAKSNCTEEHPGSGYAPGAATRTGPCFKSDNDFSKFFTIASCPLCPPRRLWCRRVWRLVFLRRWVGLRFPVPGVGGVCASRWLAGRRRRGRGLYLRRSGGRRS